MTHAATLFGFGSYFKANIKQPNDVDLLMMHKDTGSLSVGLAIEIKSLLAGKIPRAHIVMLSEQEELDVNFVQRSGAILLETFWDNKISEQAFAASRRILAQRTPGA